MYAGPDASADDLEAMFAAYASMTFGPAGGTTVPPEPAGTEITSGTTDGVPWTLTASTSGNGLTLAFDTPSGGTGAGGAAAGPGNVRGAVPVFVGTAVIGNTVFVYGFVPQRVTHVESFLVCCPPPVLGALYQLPASLGAKGMAVLVRIPLTAAGLAPDAGPGKLVAYDTRGHVVARKPFTYSTQAGGGGPSPFPDPVATLTARATASP